jgi:uncharacterized protein YbjT (DUF2867 family)
VRSFVDTRDLAAATAAALTQHRPGGHAYTITGPRLDYLR